MAIGFALDPIAPAGIRAGGGLISRLDNTNELSQSTSRIRTPDGGFIELPPQGSLSSVAVRQWYLEQEAKIPNLINGSVPLEQQALQAWSLRNAFRNAACSAMHDQDAAKMLNQTAPNLTWNQVVDKYSSKHSGDDLWRQIIGASQRSNQSVNDSLGIIVPRK